jgi:hypothetical protein
MKWRGLLFDCHSAHRKKYWNLNFFNLFLKNIHLTSIFMEQLDNFADNRLIRGCIYCGGAADTRDHVPSKCLLDKPYPPNLPVVGCCESCNHDFSKDEEYFVCLIESVLCGSTDPEKIGRASVSKILQRAPALRQRIQNSQTMIDGQIAFKPESKRIRNVMLKLARGHAAFELSQPCRKKPNHFWCGPLLSLPKEIQDEFNSVHIQQMGGEVGSRNMQRLLVTQFTMLTEKGEQQNIGMIINDWLDVQDDRYRYITINDMGELVIRIVIAEYFACEVAWKL